MSIVIERPKHDDVPELYELFEIVLKDTFERNGLMYLEDLLKNEIAVKKSFLHEDLETGGEGHHFLVARFEGDIIGTMAFGPPNDIIVGESMGKFKGVPELGTAFVKPRYQGMGVARRLFEAMVEILENKGMSHCCFDSGYPSAQSTWRRKFGEPTIHLKDYWGVGADHMIWHVELSVFKERRKDREEVHHGS